jgi:hypothetical protein
VCGFGTNPLIETVRYVLGRPVGATKLCKGVQLNRATEDLPAEGQGPPAWCLEERGGPSVRSSVDSTGRPEVPRAEPNRQRRPMQVRRFAGSWASAELRAAEYS